MTRKRDHITPVLADLHWLPVAARIQFKIALQTFKTLTTHQPRYIHDLLQQHHSSRQLRSSGHNLLEIPRMRTGFAQRSFHLQRSPHLELSTPRHHWQLEFVYLYSPYNTVAQATQEQARIRQKK